MQDGNEQRRDFLKTSATIAGLAMLGTNTLFATSNSNKGTAMRNLTPAAKATFEKLFGAIDAPLAQSDPEFFENYVNFAFDEVMSESKLELKENLMIVLASLVAIPALSEFKTILRAALKNGVNPVAIKEIIYQATPYVGMGKSIDFINASNEIFKEFNIKLPLESTGTTTRENRYEKGFGAQTEIFGDGIAKGDAVTPADMKHIRRFLSANCFGDYYTREGLTLKFRELLTFVYILSMGGAEPQVKGHIQGNLNMGNDRARLISVVTALVPYIGYPRSLNALNAIDEITLKK